MSVEYEFSTSFIERFREYLSSEEYRDISAHSKTAYWKYYADVVKIGISGNRVTVDGRSGLYILPVKSRAEFVKERVSKLINNHSR